MACERWCFNRGHDGTPRRWLYILLLAFCVLEHLDSSVANTNLDRHYYAVGPAGGSLREHEPVEFSYAEDEAFSRHRRGAEEKSVSPTTQTPHEQLQPQQLVTVQPQEQPPSQPQPQTQPQSQTVVNATNTPMKVSYLTEYSTESSTAPSSSPSPSSTSSTTVGAGVQPTETSTISADKQGTSKKPVLSTPKNITKASVMLSRNNSNANETAESNKTSTKETQAKATDENDDKDDSDSNIGDISISKFSDWTNKTLTQHNITTTEYDTHQYYNSTFIVDETIGKKYWVDIDNHPDLKVNLLLSQSHRRAATVKLKFDFPFYGHKVRNITIATGGFLYTGEYVHVWLAATQYIAPLMANFDTRLSNESFVKYADNGTAFTVVWEKVMLQDKPEAGAFTFQVTLHQNGDIVFVYSVIPLMVEKIEDTAHPVKVGLSDAYIMDRIAYFVRRKTIYEYHRVNFNRQDIKNWTVIYLNALPTCLEIDNCRDCLTKVKDFDCKWCSELNQCSTGTFRSRQDWLLKGCDVRMIKDVNNCPSATTTCKNHVDEYVNRPVHMQSEETVTVNERKAMFEDSMIHSLKHSRNDMNMGVSGIIGILLAIGLVLGLVAWVTYAYRYPHSTSGQMLIRYRPSQWSWRRGEARYTAATIHM